jgi:adenosylcobinamide kinase/adenosylcobinamide-phosphate guanylyltransferase
VGDPAAGTARLTLILGGARSGKSRYGEALAMASPPPWTYLATAEALDEEMTERIAEHRSRRGERWRTIEAPLDLAGALARIPARATVLVDCLTLWLSNLMIAGRDIDGQIRSLEQVLGARPDPSILISNEVGFGIVPDNAMARRFRDLQGRLNQRMAERADRVVLMVAGLPMVVKGNP